MFATVEVRDAPGGAKTFFRDLFLMPEIELVRVKVPFGDAFYRVIVTEYRGQVPVEETCERLRRLKGGVLFDLDFPTDERTDGLAFEAKELPAFLLFNSALDYIKGLNIPPTVSSLAVFDPTGIYADHIFKAVPLFSKIQIHTGKPNVYKQTGRELMEKFGLSLTVYDRFTPSVNSCTAVISPDGVPFDSFYGGLLFTNVPDHPLCNYCICGDGIVLPSELELLRPKGIASLHFASALYERADVRLLGELCYKKMRLT